MNDPYRQTGRTHKQIAEAPLNAVYLWCNDYTTYPVWMAEKLGRKDLLIVTPRWIREDRWRGLPARGLVIDHAVHQMAQGLFFKGQLAAAKATLNRPQEQST